MRIVDPVVLEPWIKEVNPGSVKSVVLFGSNSEDSGNTGTVDSGGARTLNSKGG